jgi:hypothetical protein
LDASYLTAVTVQGRSNIASIEVLEQRMYELLDRLRPKIMQGV